MRRLLLMLSLFLFAFTLLNAQVKVTGVVKDKVSQETLPGVQIILKGSDFESKTKSDGKFEMNNVPPGTYLLNLTLNDYEAVSQSINIENSDIDLGVIFMNLSVQNTGNDVIIELSNEELEGSDDDLQTNISGILHGSKDVFLNTAGFTFGPLRFRLRGYDNKYSNLYMNGIQTNDPESGRAVWAYWGGLNDAVRNKETFKGIAETDFSFGGIGGSTNINTRASHIRVGTKLTYSFTNRSYNHRAMFIHSTGMMKNGWALVVSGSKRYAEEGYTEGTSYDAYAYFTSIEKKFNDKHSLGLVVFGAPSKRGSRSATTQEVYDLTSTQYNPNWGWQDGEKRNAKMTDGHTPMAIFTHYWDIDNSSKLETSIAYSKGKYNKTSLNWYNAEDPRPDYYRYLPTYFDADPYAAYIRRHEFIDGERQIDWDAMHQINYRNTDTIYNADGIDGNTVTGLRSQYIVEDRRNENNQLWFNTVYKKMLSDNFKLTVGIQHRYYKARHYKTLEDLLGGDFVVDIDKYAERDLVGLGEGIADNDIRFPNHIIDEVGEVFGNDYYANVNYTELWAQVSYNMDKFDFYLSGNGSYTDSWRTGNMQNGKFPDNSLGDSEKLQFINYGAKAGVTYKLSGMHFLHADAAYMTKAPNFRNSFVSPRTRNEIVSEIKEEEIMSAQGGYVLQSSKLKATFDLFYTEFKDQSEVRSFYFDGYRSFVNFVMTGIDKTHQGMELGVEYNIIPGLSVTGVGALGYYRWTSQPVFSIHIDNNSEVLYENETVYVNGFNVEGTPQTAFSGGIKYFASKYWWIGMNANYLADRYLSFSGLTRTLNAVAEIDHSTQEFSDLISQEKLPNSFTLNAFLGKSFRFDYKYYLNISLNVSNILNDKTIQTGGYEQARIDASFENLEKFPPKLYYAQGIQYYLNISFRF